MAYRFTVHASTKITQRRIDASWIAETVENPDWREPDPTDPSLTRSFRFIQPLGNVLRVVHRPLGEDTLVVTAHPDRVARRRIER